MSSKFKYYESKNYESEYRESGYSLIAAMFGLLLSSLILTELNKNLLAAIKHAHFLEQKDLEINSKHYQLSDQRIPNCGKAIGDSLNWECHSLNGRKFIIIYAN